jgi:hypothetical protein
MVTASIAAKAGNAQQCKNSIAFATERAAGLTPEDTDAFFTDFNTVRAYPQITPSSTPVV